MKSKEEIEEEREISQALLEDHFSSTPPPKPSFSFMYVLIAIVAVIFVLSLFQEPREVTQLVGQTTPELTIRTVNGDMRKLTIESDKVRVLDFWATWCNPCYKQMPAISRLKRENSDIEIWSINTDVPALDRNQKIKNFMNKGGWKIESLLDSGSAAKLFKIEAYPTIVIIDPKGQIVFADSGVHNYNFLLKQVQKARNQ